MQNNKPKKANNGRHNIFFKYFLLFTGLITVCFTILGISLMAFVTRYSQEEKTSLLRDNTLNMSNTIRTVLDTDPLNSEYTNTNMLIASTLSVVSQSIDADVFVLDAKGHVVLCKERAANSLINFGKCSYHDNFAFNESVLNDLKNSNEPIVVRGKISEDSASYYIVGCAIDLHGEIKGYVFATTPVKGINALAIDILRMFLMSTAIALLLAFVFAYMVTYRILSPLQQMSKAAKQFAKGDFSYRVKVNGDDELADLSLSFNEMASSLATLEGSRRSFVANVSHELKTPMTTISGFIDGILDGTIPPEKQPHYLGIVSDEVKRLSRLVGAMLNMSKMETGNFKMKTVNYNLAEQIFTIFLTFEQKISNKNIEIIGLDTLEETIVNADPDMIHQVIFNLVDNAVKFTNDSGYIKVFVEKKGERVYFRVRNSGNGISAEELPKIFERFYKVDRSRSLDVNGAGLGLYIVKSMVDMHGGQIIVRSEENEYTEFEFNLSGGKTNE